MTRPFLFAAMLLCLSTNALAGPPYITDDPEPPELGKWEVYSYFEGTHSNEGSEAEAGFDINFGAAKDLQITAVIPIGMEHGETDHAGFGDLEIAAKYRFLHQAEGTLVPDVSFYPAITLPVGDDHFSSGKVGVFLPIWAQKDFGAWSMFGGAGYGINRGDESKNNWLFGYALTRQVTDALNIGAEVYHETADEKDGKGHTGIGFGMEVEVSQHWALLASAGPHLNHRHSTGNFDFYISLAFAN